MKEIQKDIIRDALKRADGNVSMAARSLKVSRENLYGRMKRLNMLNEE